MFEQSILLPDPTKKGWTFAASIVVEVAAVSFILLIPLIYTERLGMGWIQSISISPPIAKPPVTAVPQTTTRRPTTRVYDPWRPSAYLRPTLDLLNDPPEMLSVKDCPGCVPGAVPVNSTGIVGIGDDIVIPQPPKPQPKPADVKKPDPPPAAPMNVSKGAQEAKIIRRVIPAYPSLAKAARVQGVVKLQGVISTEGRIEHLQVISGHPLLVQAAVDAVKQWVYRPTLLSGQPVEVIAPIEVNFILSN